MKTKAALTFLIATMASPAMATESAFTDEQLQEIQKMLEAQRAVIRQQVIAELCEENPDTCDRIDSQVAASTPALNPQLNSAKDTRRSAEELLEAAERLSAFESMMSPLQKVPMDRSPAIDRARFDVEGSTSNSRASIEIGRTISKQLNGNKGEFTNTSIALSAPLNAGKDEDTTVATLDGLAEAFQATMKWSKFNVHGLRLNHLDDDGSGFKPEYIELCQAAGIDVLKNEQCDSNLIKQGLEERDKLDLYDAFAPLFFDPDAWKSTYGFEGAIGYQQFKFRDMATLGTDNSSEVPWSIGAYAGFIPPGNSAFYSFGLKFQEIYEAAEKKTVCPLETELAYLECVTDSIGGPKETEKHLAYVDVRSQIKKKAYSLRLTHDFKSDETGIDLPIYLLQNAKGNFNGGLRVGWTSEDDFTIGVFVGSDFSLLP